MREGRENESNDKERRVAEDGRTCRRVKKGPTEYLQLEVCVCARASGHFGICFGVAGWQLFFYLFEGSVITKLFRVNGIFSYSYFVQ